MKGFTAPRRLLALLVGLLLLWGQDGGLAYAAPRPGATATPIEHLVIIFEENVSFDHYFGTYPNSLNLPGETPFHAKPGTPSVNGFTDALLRQNPNLNPANGAGAGNPFRLSPAQAVTADQDHDYTAEQQAFDRGLLDRFPLCAGTAGPPPTGGGITGTTGLNLGYFDGNTLYGSVELRAKLRHERQPI